MTEFVLLGAGFLAGFLIGAIAVGGAVLVPLLILGAGIAPHQAIAMSLAAFVAPGALGAFWTTQEDFNRAMLTFLGLSAAVGAGLGALGMRLVSEDIVTWVVIAAALAAAASIFIRRKRLDKLNATPTIRQSSVVGIITGIGSAVSGTSGPLVLVPCLTFLGTSLRPAIVLSQGVQAPVAVAATALNLSAGLVLVLPTIILSLALVGGMVCGNRLGRRLSAALLKRGLAATLLMSALLMMAYRF